MVDVDDVPDPDGVRGIVAGALVSFATTTTTGVVEGETTGRMAVVCVVVPMLLTRAAAAATITTTADQEEEQERKQIFASTSKHLLTLAGDQKITPVFRGVVRKMSPAQREFMERVITEGGAIATTGGRGASGVGEAGAGVEDGEGGKGEPRIALKMNFG